MRILFVLSEYLPDSGGGIITFYQYMLSRLAEAGVDVTVLVARKDCLDRKPTRIDGVRVEYLTSESLSKYADRFQRFDHGFNALNSFLPIAWAAFHQANAGHRYDVVEVTDWQLLFAPWLVDCETPVNLSLHSSVGQMDIWAPIEESGPYGDLVRLIEVQAVREAASVQTNSRANARFWSELSGRVVDWLPPVVQLKRYESIPTNDRSSAGLVVGRLQDLKGPELLCQALAETKSTVQVDWVGSDAAGPHGPSMIDFLGQKYPTVVGRKLNFIGAKSHDEVLNRMRAARFVCVPSKWDVFNMTAVEGIMMQTPVLCSTEAGAELLFDDRSVGLRFDPHDTPEFAARLDEMDGLSESARKDIVEKAIGNLLEIMSPQKVVEKRKAAYETMCSKKITSHGSPWYRKAVEPSSVATDSQAILRTFPAGEIANSLRDKVRNRTSSWLKK